LATRCATINDVVGDGADFVADNRESLGTASDKLASVTQAWSTAKKHQADVAHRAQHLPELHQHLPTLPRRALAVLAATNFANPISFPVRAIQAASRLGAEQSAKLCVQYLAPIIKNRQ